MAAATGAERRRHYGPSVVILSRWARSVEAFGPEGRVAEIYGYQARSPIRRVRTLVWTQPGVRFIRQFSCEDGALQARARHADRLAPAPFSRRDRKRKNLRHQNSLKNNRKIVARRRRRTNLCNKATLHQEYTRLVKYLVFEPRTKF